MGAEPTGRGVDNEPSPVKKDFRTCDIAISLTETVEVGGAVFLRRRDSNTPTFAHKVMSPYVNDTVQCKRQYRVRIASFDGGEPYI